MILAAANPTVSRTAAPCRPAVRPQGAPRLPRPETAPPDRRRPWPRCATARRICARIPPTRLPPSPASTLRTRAVARRMFVAAGGQIGHQEIADHGADIEPHRAIECELRIDHPRLALRHHDRAGMEVAVDQRFRRRMNFSLSRETATCSSRSSRKRAAVASSHGCVQRFCSAMRYGSVKIRSSVILQSAWLPAKAAIPSFFSPAGPRDPN